MNLRMRILVLVGIRLYVEVDLPGREFPLQHSPDMIVTVLALLAESAEKMFWIRLNVSGNQ